MLPSARTAFCVCIVPLLGQVFLCATAFSRALQGSGMCAIAQARTLEGTLVTLAYCQLGSASGLYSVPTLSPYTLNSYALIT